MSLEIVSATVAEVIEFNPTLRAIRFVPDKGGLACYAPGDYLFVRVPTVAEENSLSTIRSLNGQPPNNASKQNVGGSEMENKRAVLWDFDGVLFPTEELRDQVHQEVVGRFGGHISPDFYKEIGGAGRAHDEVRGEFIRASGITASPEKYTRILQKILRQKLMSLVSTPGVWELLSALQAKGYLQAVVSSSLRSEVLPALIKAGLASFFSTVVCGDEVARKKPAPDGYLMALEDLEIHPAQAVAIEDSRSGIDAALAADLRVIAFRHEYNEGHDFVGANLVIVSFTRQARVLRLYLGL